MTDPIGKEHCGKCDHVLTTHYFCCDRTMKCYCDKCWPKTACGKGKHGEGCPTQVFDDKP